MQKFGEANGEQKMEQSDWGEIFEKRHSRLLLQKILPYTLTPRHAIVSHVWKLQSYRKQGAFSTR